MKRAVQAYLASISYLDGQIGRVLDALEVTRKREYDHCFLGVIMDGTWERKNTGEN